MIPKESPVIQVTFAQFGDDKDPELAPDAKLLYFSTSAYSNDYDIYRKKIEATSVSSVISNPGSDERFPKISPKNPKTMAFCSNKDGEWDIFIVLDIEKDPGQWIKISESGWHDIHPSWSPDGKKIAFCATRDYSDWVIKIVDIPTRTIFIPSKLDGLLPEWNPNDDRIVFQRMRHRGNWFSGLWVFRFKDGTAKDLVNIISGTDWAAINPSWSPDGKMLVFSTVAKDKLMKGVLDHADDIWVMNDDGTNITQITFHPAHDWMPVWGKDGRIYFASDRQGRYQICSIKPRLNNR
jgi:Tol biopolymer transport system component